MRTLTIYLMAVLTLPLLAWGHEGIDNQIEDINKSIQTDPATYPVFLRRADLYRRQGNWKQSKTDLKNAQKLNAPRDQVQLGLSHLYWDQGKSKKALRILNRLLKKNPQHAGGLLLRARIHSEMGNWKRAIEDMSNFLSVSSKVLPDYYVELNGYFKNISSLPHQQALENLETGMVKLGPLVILQQEALEWELKMNNYEAALKRIDQILSQFTRKEKWYLKKGEIFEAMGRFREANQQYQLALFSINSLPPHLQTTVSVKNLLKQIHSRESNLSRIQREGSHQ